jgi:hypothetical protein
MSYLVARKLVQRDNMDMECRYLEGSRFAWRMAEYHMLSDEEILDKICLGGVSVTLHKILSRGGLDLAEIEKIARELSLYQDLERQLTYSETQEYKKKLAENKEILSLIRKHSMEAFDATYDYFVQEGLLDLQTISIVDSGWVGSMQQTLSNLVGRDVEGYYFGLYELPVNADKIKYHTYFFQPYIDIEKKTHFNNCLFESVFSAPQGMTCRYEKGVGKTNPIRETENNPNKQRIMDNVALLTKLLDGSQFIDDIDKVSPDLHLREMQRIMVRPSKDEVEWLGSYLFSDDVNEDSIQELAVSLSRKEIRNTHVVKRALIMSGLTTGELKDSAWLEGSIVRGGKNVQYHLWHCRWYKRLIYVRKYFKHRSFEGHM